MGLFNRQKRLYIEAACGCNRGLKRVNNEDNFIFNGEHLEAQNDGLDKTLELDRSVPVKKIEEGLIFAVFDGMGGEEYGEIASNVAAVTAVDLFRTPNAICLYDVSASITELITMMNDKVFHTRRDLGASNIGSTAVGLFFFSDYCWTFNVGDSKCFFFRDRSYQQLSVDHNNSAVLKLQGVVDQKPRLTQYLGIDRNEMKVSPAVSRKKIKAGDTWLICSDGLTDMVPMEEILEVMQKKVSIREQTEELIRRALAQGGKDNITVIICNVCCSGNQ